MRDDGYVKFRCEWTLAPPLDRKFLEGLMSWRDRLYGLGLIGQYPDGIGYGNLSVRDSGPGRFIVSGTQTGGFPQALPEHFARVTRFDLEANLVVCEGPVKASSESLTHGVFYEIFPRVNAVIHVHHEVLWNELFGRVPVTGASYSYGTPELAREIQRIFKEERDPGRGILVMQGHEGGVVAYGRDLEDAGSCLLARYEVHKPLGPGQGKDRSNRPLN